MGSRISRETWGKFSFILVKRRLRLASPVAVRKGRTKNPGDRFSSRALQQVGERPDILVAMDWTDFDHDGQSTLVLSLVTGHGRAAPLIWLTIWKEEIATRRNDYEDACLRRLAETMSAVCRVTILADRGFGDQ